MVVARSRLRDHHRKVWQSREERGVHVVVDEHEVLGNEIPDYEGVRIGQVHFVLAVGVAGVAALPLGVVLRLCLYDLAQYGPHIAVVRLYDGRIQVRIHSPEPELDFIELPRLDFLGIAFVAEYRGRKAGKGMIPRLKLEISVQVCGDSDCGSLEIHPGERDALSGLCIRDTPPDPGRLSQSPGYGHREQGRDGDCDPFEKHCHRILSIFSC